MNKHGTIFARFASDRGIFARGERELSKLACFQMFLPGEGILQTIIRECQAGVVVHGVTGFLRKHGLSEAEFQEILRHLYMDKKLSPREIAELYDTSFIIIIWLLRDYGLLEPK